MTTIEQIDHNERMERIMDAQRELGRVSFKIGLAFDNGGLDADYVIEMVKSIAAVGEFLENELAAATDKTLRAS